MVSAGGHPKDSAEFHGTEAMTYGSVCSGIEAVSVAWEPLGFQPAWFAEIDPFCSRLLAHHYPQVSNRGDFTRIEPDGTAIDLLAGGTPCHYAERRTMPYNRIELAFARTSDTDDSA